RDWSSDVCSSDLEESGLLGSPGGEWTWLVDPLDGTNNVAIGLPAYVVGLALCREGRPLVGVVHDPVTARTWSAIRGRGALASSGSRLSAAYRPSPHGPLPAWTQGYAVSRKDAKARLLKAALRSEERRVGREGRGRSAADPEPSNARC